METGIFISVAATQHPFSFTPFSEMCWKQGWLSHLLKQHHFKWHFPSSRLKYNAISEASSCCSANLQSTFAKKNCGVSKQKGKLPVATQNPAEDVHFFKQSLHWKWYFSASLGFFCQKIIPTSKVVPTVTLLSLKSQSH